MPAHQVFSLTAYIFETSYSTSDTHANKSMDQSELLNLWAGIGTLTYCQTGKTCLNKGKITGTVTQRGVGGPCYSSPPPSPPPPAPTVNNQDVIVFAIERLELKIFSCRPTMVSDNTFQYSMASPLWNPFCRS